jgi:hypothetical protein
MNRIWLRTVEKLTFEDPVPYLIQLRRREITVALSDMRPEEKAMRTNDLKIPREQREAALFCLGMSERLGHKVYFSVQEDQDYDFVARWMIGEMQHYAQVQLKEVVPVKMNLHSSIEGIVESLGRLTDSNGLTVAIHLNRECRFEPSLLKVPEKLKVASLWVFASTTADQSCWALWGNFTENEPFGNQFSYPAGD